MPFIRKGKTVYNQITGKSKGTSATVEMAKRHMRALYANTPREDLIRRHPKIKPLY